MRAVDVLRRIAGVAEIEEYTRDERRDHTPNEI